MCEISRVEKKEQKKAAKTMPNNARCERSRPITLAQPLGALHYVLAVISASPKKGCARVANDDLTSAT